MNTDRVVAPRDQVLDGFRAVAACGVVFSHAFTYRFVGETIPGSHLLGRVAGPVAEISVQIFFVISGYIITSLLMREETRHGRPNLAAFFARRLFRIVPPLAVFIATIGVLDVLNTIELDLRSYVQAATFTCNTNLPDCGWWVAHSWSLAVEEQFYLIWPALFVLMPIRFRSPFLICTVALLLIIFFVQAPTYHANTLSFACIATGALMATKSGAIKKLTAAARPSLWILAAVIMLLGPLTGFERVVAAGTPFLICYLIFAARALEPLARLLSSRPVQVVAAGSYSLYLWQQLFLAAPELYVHGPPSILLLPLAVFLSVYTTEKPFIRLGQKLSRRLSQGTGLSKGITVVDARRGAHSPPST